MKCFFYEGNQLAIVNEDAVGELGDMQQITSNRSSSMRANENRQTPTVIANQNQCTSLVIANENASFARGTIMCQEKLHDYSGHEHKKKQMCDVITPQSCSCHKVVKVTAV